MNTEEREEDNALSQARIRTVVSARTPSKDQIDVAEKYASMGIYSMPQAETCVEKTP